MAYSTLSPTSVRNLCVVRPVLLSSSSHCCSLQSTTAPLSSQGCVACKIWPKHARFKFWSTMSSVVLEQVGGAVCRRSSVCSMARDAADRRVAYKCTARSCQGSICHLILYHTNKSVTMKLIYFRAYKPWDIINPRYAGEILSKILFRDVQNFLPGPWWQCDSCRKHSRACCRGKKSLPCESPKASTSYRRPSSSFRALAPAEQCSGHRSSV